MRNKLSARQVQTAKKVGRYADGGGLYLLICRPGYKQWTFRYMLAGRAREMAIGPVTDVSLAQARVKAAEARALTREGRDPIGARRWRAFSRSLAIYRCNRSTRPSSCRPCCQFGSGRQKRDRGCAVGSRGFSSGRDRLACSKALILHPAKS